MASNNIPWNLDNVSATAVRSGNGYNVTFSGITGNYPKLDAQGISATWIGMDDNQTGFGDTPNNDPNVTLWVRDDGLDIGWIPVGSLCLYSGGEVILTNSKGIVVDW